MTTLAGICDDLAAEHSDLDRIVSGLDDKTWERDTPAVGWNIRDQISHLAFFDEVGAQAVADPEAFTAQLGAIAADPVEYIDRALKQGRELGPQGVLDWWRKARSDSIDVLLRMEPGTLVPWFGPPMKPISFVTGRLMETWAHGQDVVDTLGLHREATPRLRHVAHMGVRARGFSFDMNGRSRPQEDVLVELDGPDGDKWTWGEPGENSVRGDAYDFCLVVTQRRHLLDTDLEVEGPVAEDWMGIAQSFAGPGGEGRKPGQFPKRSKT